MSYKSYVIILAALAIIFGYSDRVNASENEPQILSRGRIRFHSSATINDYNSVLFDADDFKSIYEKLDDLNEKINRMGEKI